MNWLAIGATLMALAVGLGAFGAHGLADRVTPKDLEIWRTGAYYHMVHALALVALGLSGRAAETQPASWLLLAGIAVFSGSLYLLVLTQQRWLGAITPIGGLAFIAAWIVIAARAVKAGA